MFNPEEVDVGRPDFAMFISKVMEEEMESFVEKNAKNGCVDVDAVEIQKMHVLQRIAKLLA